jgi:catechol 2,3-dioxygenase-like lactoylglutathione lyase family enzyme
VAILGDPVQIAYATDDVHRSAREWADRGVGPFFVIEHIELIDVEVDGRSATFDHSSAYGQWGNVMVELICQHDPGDDPVVGSSGVHHIASFVDDLEATSAELVDDGLTCRLRASTSGGQSFAFHDARATHGHLLEIYEPTNRLVSFYDMVRDAATGWTGRDPIRIL